MTRPPTRFIGGGLERCRDAVIRPSRCGRQVPRTAIWGQAWSVGECQVHGAAAIEGSALVHRRAHQGVIEHDSPITDPEQPHILGRRQSLVTDVEPAQHRSTAANSPVSSAATTSSRV